MKNICEGWIVFYENHVLAFVCVFEYLDFWGGRWSWNKNTLLKKIGYFYTLTWWLLSFFCYRVEHW